ncbi:hypothetical protein WDL1CHR_05987 [Variovorax sp. WDL1]|nr:hypothetical protein CHC07_04448 [Variovorax sp. B4]PNG54617.1 hypothetical protein CHC06_03414 [Variovorax sp. B2]VTV15595.1 hypothetical protein WDL1CHR_05987 [Variovorax sp. WDL1]
MRQSLESVCSELARAIEHPELFALLGDPFRHQIIQLVADGRVSLAMPKNHSIGADPRWSVITPIRPEGLAALVRLGTLLISVDAPTAAARYGVALLMNLMHAGLAEADRVMVRRCLVEVTLGRLPSATGLLSSPLWLPVLCEAVSQPIPQPVDRLACQTMLRHWIQAWRNDEETCIEPRLVVEQLRQVLVAQTDVQRSEQDDATLVFLVEELFKGALKREASAEAEWALRALQQWTGDAARLAFARCVPQMPISEELRNVEILDGQCRFKGGDLKASLAFGVNSPEFLLKLLHLANFRLRTRALLRVARQQGQEGPPVRPRQGESRAGVVPPRFCHEMALLLLREAVELLRAPLPPLDDVSALVHAGLAHLLRSDELSPMNPKGSKYLKDLMPLLVGLLERLPATATAAIDFQLMCLKVLGRWQADVLRLEPDQVLRILRSLDVSETAGVPTFVVRTQLRTALHRLYDTVAARSGTRPDLLEMLEKVARLHEERFGPDSFDRERIMSGWARKQLEARNWEPLSFDDPGLLTDLIATPEEQSRVIDHLLHYAQQPSSLEPEACLQAAALLCHYTARSPDTLESTGSAPAPALDRALELARACAGLLLRVGPPERHADDLFGGVALVLGNPLLGAGLARQQWEGVGDRLLQGVEERAYSVASDILLQLIEAHSGAARLGQRTGDALIQLYLQQPECRRTIVKVLEIHADREPERSKALLRECREAHQDSQRDRQAQALKETLCELGFDYDWRDMSGGSADASTFNLLLKSGPRSYVEQHHRQYLQEIVKVTPHPEECWRLLAFLASHDFRIGNFSARAGGLSISVQYGSRLTICCLAGSTPGITPDEKALKHLAEFLARHFQLDVGSAMRLQGNVLEVDAMKVNAFEVGQCINLLLGVLQVLHEMGGEPDLLLGQAGFLHRFLPSLANATASLNPQGVVRLLLDMEGDSKTPSSTLDDFFLKNFEWLPCDRADRVLKLATNTRTSTTAPQRLQLGERIIAALMAAGLPERARDAAKSLLAVCSEGDLTAPSQQSTAGLPPWQLRARSLLLCTAWDRLDRKDLHMESFGMTLRAIALSAATDESVHDYLDWAQSITLAEPATMGSLLDGLPAPRTWHDILRRREMQWRHIDELSWRFVTWSPAPVGWHVEQESPPLNGKRVRFRMPFHSALAAKVGNRLNEAEVIYVCIVNSRHLEPAEVPRVGAAVRTLFEKLLSMRRSGAELQSPSDLLSEDILRGLLNEPSVPADAREKLERMLAELQDLTGSPHEDLLRGLPYLVAPFFQANAREALEWTLAMARLLADGYPDVAAKLLDQVPFDAREMQPEWQALTMRVQSLASKASPATVRLVPPVKDVLTPADSFQIPRVSVGLAVDSLGELTLTDDGTPSPVEYGNLLREYVEQIQPPKPFGTASTDGEPATLARKCLRDLETAVGLLQQVQCRDPLSLIRGIVRSKGAAILQLIGSGRIGCRVNPRDAPDFGGVRARWQLPLDLNQYEADCVNAFVTSLVRSFEPAGMSLFQVLVCQESLDGPQCSRIIDGMFKLWDANNAAPNRTDGAWAGMLLVLEHRGLIGDGTSQRAKGMRTTLMQRWRARSDMPLLAAMAVIKPHDNTFYPHPETLPTLEVLFNRSRGEPDADRIAMWIMRRLHYLDGKEVRDIESRLRRMGALPLLDDTKSIVEEQLRALGIDDPVKDELDKSKHKKTSRLVNLWAWCASNPEDGSTALLRSGRGKRGIAEMTMFARLGLALPGENPDSRRLAREWLNSHGLPRGTCAGIARAFLVKFAQGRLPLVSSNDWENEWWMASTLAALATLPSHSQYPSLQVIKYLAETLDQFSLHSGYRAFLPGMNSAIHLCQLWKTQYPAGCQVLLPATRTAAQRASEMTVSPDYYPNLVSELERHS